MEERLNRKRLSMTTKVGYGLGGSCDTIPYYLYGTYFMFFLTDVVGVSAGAAGTISFIAILCQAVAGPVVAYISDNSLNPKGRRTPLLLKVAIPFAIVTALLFNPISGSMGVKITYYLVLSILFYICYAAYTSVWSALGAELSSDYKERNNIRSIVSYAAFPFTLVASSGTIGMVGFFNAKGMEYDRSWFFAVLVLAVLMAAGAIICRNTAVETPPQYTEEEKAAIRSERFSAKKLIVDYISFFRIKVFRKMILFTFIFVIGYIIMNNGTVYGMTGFLGLNEAQQSLFWTLNSIIAIICVPIVFGIANKWDKKKAMILFVGAYGLSSVIWFVMGMVIEIGFASFVLFSGCVALGTTAFYSLIFSLLYDCCDVYTLATGEQKEGGMLALQYLAQTVGGAIAALFLGWGLEFFGYTGAETISDTTADGIWMLCTIIPAVFVAVSMIFLCRYNLSRADFEKVQQAIKDRKEGKEVDMSKFKHLI